MVLVETGTDDPVVLVERGTDEPVCVTDDERQELPDGYQKPLALFLHTI
jgi:hypothetical protein